MLITKSILLQPSPEDGLCISVMSRHTLSDGITPHPEITPKSYNLWQPELAPPPTLIGAYYRRGLPWSEFETEYNNHLAQPEVINRVFDLIELAKDSLVTVLCIETSPKNCHRRLLAQACLSLDADLQIKIN